MWTLLGHWRMMRFLFCCGMECVATEYLKPLRVVTLLLSMVDAVIVQNTVGT